MRFNSLGSALYGTSHPNIDGVQVAALAAGTGGGWGWFNDTTIVGGMTFGGNFGMWKLALPATLTQLDNQGVNESRAGGGNWAALLVLGTGPFVRTSVAGFGPLSGAGLGDIAPDGKFAIVQDRQGDFGIVTYSAAGTLLHNNAVGVAPGSEIRARDGVFVYRSGDGLGSHLRDLTTGALQAYAPRTETVFQLVPVLVGGVMYVVEWTGATLATITVRKATSSTGFVVASNVPVFGMDALNLTGTTIRIGWCSNAGESANSLMLADLDVKASTFSTGTTSGGGAPVFTSQPPLSGASSFPTGPVEGGGTLRKNQVPRDPITDPKQNYFTTRTWWKFFQSLVDDAASPVQLSGPGVSGTLPPEKGGTGGTSGLAVLNGNNIVPNTTPLDVAQIFGPFTLGDGRNQIVAGPLTISGYLQVNGSGIFTVI